MFRDVPGCSGIFRNVPECSRMFHVPGFIDALYKHENALWVFSWSDFVITWDRDELCPVQICNFCSRLHATGTKRYVDYMRPVQIQKQEILGAI